MIRLIQHDMTDPELRQYDRRDYQLSLRMPEVFLPHLLDNEIHGRVVTKADILAPVLDTDDMGPELKVRHPVYNRQGKYSRNSKRVSRS